MPDLLRADAGLVGEGEQITERFILHVGEQDGEVGRSHPAVPLGRGRLLHPGHQVLLDVAEFGRPVELTGDGDDRSPASGSPPRRLRVHPLDHVERAEGGRQQGGGHL